MGLLSQRDQREDTWDVYFERAEKEEREEASKLPRNEAVFEKNYPVCSLLQRFRKDRLVSFKLLPKFLPKILFQKQYITEFCYFIEIKEFIQLFKIITSSKKKKKKLKSSFKSFSSQNKRLNSRNKFSVNKMTKQTFQQEVSHNFYKIFPWMDNKPEATSPPPLSRPCLQLPDNFHIFHEIYSIDQGTWLDGPGESVNMKNKRGEKRRHLNKDSYLPLWISSHMDRIVSASFDH